MGIHVRFNIGNDVADRLTLPDFKFETRQAAEKWVRETAAIRYPLADSAVLIQGGDKPFSINIRNL